MAQVEIGLVIDHELGINISPVCLHERYPLPSELDKRVFKITPALAVQGEQFFSPLTFLQL